YHAVTIDLTRYRIVHSPPGSYGQVASAFASSRGALVVINSNFAPGAGGPSCGLLEGFGRVDTSAYLDADRNNCRDSIGFRFGDGFCDAFDSISIYRGPVPQSFTDVATGMPFMVR